MLIDGTDRARQAVRQNALRNVDLIKVSADEGLTVPELAAVVEQAHRQHFKVAVHAFEKISIQTAIDAGADSIEHGNEVTDEQLKQMRDKGIVLDLTPTSYGGFLRKITEPSIVVSTATRAADASSAPRRKQPGTSVGSAGAEVRSEVCRGIGYGLVLSGKDARGSKHLDFC